MYTVDTRGKKCPLPIIETRKALRASQEGETFEVVTDDRTAFSNISRFLKDNKVRFTVSEAGSVWTFLITGTGLADINSNDENIEAVNSEAPTGNFAVVISSEIMGQGDDELGRRLMKSFFIALSCLELLPSSV